jgi:Tol biopolymer transport system component
LRLTDDPAADDEPDFSPDGSQIVFHSTRAGGGLYLMPALGGTARLLMNDGRRPRFSPDGSHIAFVAGAFRGAPITGAARTLVLSLRGGEPRRVGAALNAVRDPIWFPDGQALLAVVRTTQDSDDSDWWRIPIDSGPPVRTHVWDRSDWRTLQPLPGAFLGNDVFFAARRELLSLPLSPSGEPTGAARRLMLGAGLVGTPAVSANGDVAFSVTTRERIIERDDLNSPSPKRTIIFRDARSDAARASHSDDGTLVVFERPSLNSNEIWIKDYRRSQQNLIVKVDTNEQLDATVSQDAQFVSYNVRAVAGALGEGFVVGASGGVPRQVCPSCILHGFTRDGRHVLAATRTTLLVIDVETRVSQTAIAGDSTNRPHLSPNEQWLAFRANREDGTPKSFIAPFSPGHPPQRNQWLEVQEPTATGRPASWSADSQTLYLVLDTDGFRCLWGQRVDATGHLVGVPSVVRHMHDLRSVSTSLGNAVSLRGDFLYERTEDSSDLWRLTGAASPRKLDR